MAERRAFSRAKADILGAHESRASLCSPFVSAFPITGASVSVLAGPTGNSTICSSDATADRLDEMQFDLGEGPCWTALELRAPVLRRDIGAAREDWPAFSEAFRNDRVSSRVSSMFAFPLTVGSIDLGAIDLYTAAPHDLESTQVAEASELASLTAWQVLRRILGDHADEYDSSIGHSRREVHQATGMLIVQLGVGPEDAELLLRAHAFASGRSVREVANDIVERRLDLTPEPADGGSGEQS